MNKPACLIGWGRHPSHMRILWGSEQPTRQTGFGRVTRELAKRLVGLGHEVFIMGWEYTGEDFKHEEGWTLVDCGIPNGKFGGEQILGDRGPTILERNLAKYQPDIYVSLIDIWSIPHAIQSCNQAGVPYLAYLPIDGAPIPQQWADIFKHLHTPLFMSEFGLEEFDMFADELAKVDPAFEHYLETPARFVHHGVDLEVFKPSSEEQQAEIRKRLQIPDEWETIFLSVARNMNRKQTPRLLEAFKLAMEQSEDPEKWGLILHTGDPENVWNQGWHLPSLIERLGIQSHVRFSDTDCNPCFGLDTTDLASLYSIASAHVLATGGEGFGLTSVEALATGCPIILPDNSTGPELISDCDGENIHHQRGFVWGKNGILVRCATAVNREGFGIGLGLVDIPSLSNALTAFHELSHKKLVRLKVQSRLVAEELFGWDDIATQFEAQLSEAAKKPHPLSQTDTTEEE